MCHLVFYPAPPNTGIYINNIRVDIRDIKYVHGATAVGDVMLIEHFLSSCYALGITNLFISSSCSEFPIFDGGSKYYMDLLTPHLLK